MKIYDCFLFNDENHILEIRLNELKNYVDFFVIVEFGENHQGKYKGKKINSKLIKKFNQKIIYLYFKNFNKKLGPWEKENFQRNKILDGLKNADDKDIIIISDIDEIPKLKKINFKKVKNTVYAFNQVHYMYKLNLIRVRNWVGTKLCSKKILKSPQWLRSLKVEKKYNFWRIDKYFSKTYYKNFKIINNAGWHFGWLRSPNQIIEKIQSYAHFEHNINKFKNKNYIKKCISKKVSFLNNNEKLIFDKKKNLPPYVKKNIIYFKKWLA